MHAHRRLAVLVAATVAFGVATTVGLAWLVGGDEDPSGIPPSGPLTYRGDSYGASTPRDVGEAVTFSGAEVRNSTERDVVLEDVRLLEPTPELEVLGLLAAPTPINEEFDLSSAGFPPDDQAGNRLDPLDGFVVPSGSEAQLFVGLRATDVGKRGFRRLLVIYRYEGERYSLELPWSYVICTPRQVYLETPCLSLDE